MRGIGFAHAQACISVIVDELHEMDRVLKYRVRIIRLVCMPVRKLSNADCKITWLIRQNETRTDRKQTKTRPMTRKRRDTP